MTVKGYFASCGYRKISQLKMDARPDCRVLPQTRRGTYLPSPGIHDTGAGYSYALPFTRAGYCDSQPAGGP
jgi:hypothetical protein